MLAQSGARVEESDPVVSVRYDDGSVREFVLERLRLADFSGSAPWRQVRSLHGQSHYPGSYASATTGGFVVYESRLELARLLLADFDPRVQQIYAQPLLLVARADGRARRHVPGFLLVSAAETARLVNVKPAARLRDPEVAEALAWPGVLAERRGWEYEVRSGADVTVLENIRFPAGYRHPAYSHLAGARVPPRSVPGSPSCRRAGGSPGGPACWRGAAAAMTLAQRRRWHAALAAARWTRSHLALWMLAAGAADTAVIALIAELPARPGQSASAVNGLILLSLVPLALSVAFPVAGSILEARDKEAEEKRNRSVPAVGWGRSCRRRVSEVACCGRGRRG